MNFHSISRLLSTLHVFYYDGRVIVDRYIASITTTHCGLHLRIYPDIQVVKLQIAWPTMA
jgi:hypothetical protein